VEMVRKDNTKRILEKHFIIDVDYKVETITPPTGMITVEFKFIKIKRYIN
jgi:hypothetical protein